ncbi:MAG TPA: acetyl-CoA hydrolase/transferase C-terminal domain-containing protein [Candidatus Eisenbacteria bacterium]|nr:acetyl-CoA hydrolase/transferase C-terminal domain-containing protein [Candidatus Eisenbacteria bacterium]
MSPASLNAPAVATPTLPRPTLDYHDKLATPEEALRLVRPGDTVYVHPGCAAPQTLLAALVARKDDLHDVRVIHLMSQGRADYALPGMEPHFRHVALFIGKNTRDAVNDGRADYLPVFLSEIPRLFTTRTVPLEVALIHVSPPDEHGFCSFGVGVECTKAAASTARVVIAQVNPRMPRVLGDNFIHVRNVTRFVEVDEPLVELPRVRMADAFDEIGRNVAALVEDGSTLQLGIGGIPDAVLHHLRDRKHLGVHTEMFSDGMVELVQAGIVTSERKTLHPGKIVASFVLGTQPLFDFIHDNPIVEFHPSDYVNDPFVIAQNDRMVAINSAIQIDLTGQVCSDSIGDMAYSGFGGQVDFVRGASRARGGKAIIALPSTARGGEVSRIAPYLDPGAGVVTSRADVHFVATEFGVADLYGKSLRERARALIDIAHPRFREELERGAMKRKLL